MRLLSESEIGFLVLLFLQLLDSMGFMLSSALFSSLPVYPDLQLTALALTTILDLKQLHDTDILSMLFGYSYLFPSTGEGAPNPLVYHYISLTMALIV